MEGKDAIRQMRHMAFFEAIATGTLAGRGKTALAQRFDRWSLWIFPAVFAVLVAFVFLR